jgi:hypothetical protein
LDAVVGTCGRSPRRRRSTLLPFCYATATTATTTTATAAKRNGRRVRTDGGSDLLVVSTTICSVKKILRRGSCIDPERVIFRRTSVVQAMPALSVSRLLWLWLLLTDADYCRHLLLLLFLLCCLCSCTLLITFLALAIGLAVAVANTRCNRCAVVDVPTQVSAIHAQSERCFIRCVLLALASVSGIGYCYGQHFACLKSGCRHCAFKTRALQM